MSCSTEATQKLPVDKSHQGNHYSQDIVLNKVWTNLEGQETSNSIITQFQDKTLLRSADQLQQFLPEDSKVSTIAKPWMAGGPLLHRLSYNTSVHGNSSWGRSRRVWLIKNKNHLYLEIKVICSAFKIYVLVLICSLLEKSLSKILMIACPGPSAQ